MYERPFGAKRPALVTLVLSGAAVLPGAIVLSGWSACAFALDADITTKLPYNIAYELAPIEVAIRLKGGAGAGASYHVYDVYKREIASGKLDAGGKTFSFTPPKYGWYMVSCEAGGRGVAKFVGVTPRFPGMHALSAGDMKGGWNDSALIAFAGLGLDRTNTRHRGIDGLAGTLEHSRKYAVPLLVQFEGKEHCRPDHVREAVTKYRGRVKYWEVMNEPNFGMGPADYAKMVAELYPLIKGADPAAVVMGPDVCGINLGWYDGFYRAGGGRFIDALFIRDYEGDESIDPFHWQWKMQQLRRIMAEHGDAKKPIWQTERAIGGVRGKVFLGATQAVRVTLQRDLLEAFGVTNEHNSHYYANVTGYNDVPTFVCSQSGPHPLALVARTRRAMTLGRSFAGKLEFGPTGNKILLGLFYKGKKGATVTLRNLGTRDLSVQFGVRGGSSLEVVDSFGNVEKVRVRSGKAALRATQMPVYLRLAGGQRLVPPKIDFGRNIAPEATFTYSGGTQSPEAILKDGRFQIFHAGNPWGKTWVGGYPGKVFDEAPRNLDVTFGGKRKIGAMIVYGVRADNPHCALLDYDVQYHDGARWVTLDEVRAHCPESDAVRTYICETVTWYLDSNCYVHRFAEPVTTDRLRLVIRRITRGFMVDMAAERAAGWKASGESLELREIEIYGLVPSPGLLAGQAARTEDAAEAEAAPPRPAPRKVPEPVRRRVARPTRKAAPRVSEAKEAGEGEDDPRAAALYKQAETRFVEGELEEAAGIFARIVERYPGTKSAKKAAEYLAILK